MVLLLPAAWCDFSRISIPRFLPTHGAPETYDLDIVQVTHCAAFRTARPAPGASLASVSITLGRQLPGRTIVMPTYVFFLSLTALSLHFLALRWMQTAFRLTRRPRGCNPSWQQEALSPIARTGSLMASNSVHCCFCFALPAT
jgi:hypothetical protein